MTGTYTFDSGPPGLETTHTWQNVFTMNQKDRTNGYVHLTSIGGLGGLPEAPEKSLPHVNRRGTFPLPVQPATATAIYGGVVRGKTLEAVRRCTMRAKKAFRDRNTEGMMVINGVRGGPSWFYRGRPQMLEIPDEQSLGPDSINKWDRTFTLQILVYDPRIYYGIPNISTLASGQKTVDNVGYTDTDPYFSVPNFSGGNLEFQNDANNRLLRFENLPAGNYTLDFYKRVLLRGELEDFTGHMDVISDWWDPSVQGLLPGINQVRVYGNGGSTPAWQLTFFPALEA